MFFLLWLVKYLFISCFFVSQPESGVFDLDVTLNGCANDQHRRNVQLNVKIGSIHLLRIFFGISEVQPPSLTLSVMFGHNLTNKFK